MTSDTDRHDVEHTQDSTPATRHDGLAAMAALLLTAALIVFLATRVI